MEATGPFPLWRLVTVAEGVGCSAAPEEALPEVPDQIATGIMGAGIGATGFAIGCNFKHLNSPQIGKLEL